MKEFWLDVETTGTNPKVHEITQIAGEICGEQFNFFCRPTSWDVIEPEALEAQNRTIEQLRSFPDASIAFNGLVNILSKYVNKFDKNKENKLNIFAFNATFDRDFLNEFFRRYSPKKPDPRFPYEYYVSNFCINIPVCVMQAYRLAVMAKKFPIPENFKLQTLCGYHGIEFKPHDALEDIIATKKLFKVVRNALDIGEIQQSLFVC